MSITTPHGSPQFPITQGNIQASTQDAMDQAVQTLRANKQAWVASSVHDRVAIIEKLISEFAAIALRWVITSCQAKGIPETSSLAGEEWMIGPWPVLKNLRQLRQSL